MDTGTHFVMGLGLAGLAHVDPVVAADAETAIAVLIGTVLGSQAPDSDGLLRLKGNGIYIRNHRGWSHSVPAVIGWTLSITALVALMFGSAPVLHVGFWVGLAVCLHVFTDLFNTYGTQALRPFSEKWISWNIIHIFDPVIFLSHALALFLWVSGQAEPTRVFPALYALLAVYYVWRTLDHYRMQKRLPQRDGQYESGDDYVLIPTMHPFQWNVLKRKPSGDYMLGELKQGDLKWIDQVRNIDHPAVEASKKHPDIASFLYFSSYACPELKIHEWGYEVRWVDVRYRHRKHYPFVGVLLMDRDFQVLDSYVGWLNDTRLAKKLRVDSYS